MHGNERHETAGGGRTRFVAIFAVLLIVLPFSVSAAFPRPLATGSVGTDVQELQQFLKDRDFFPLAQTTTYFGPLTKDALAKFQVSVGLEAVGQVGPKTLALLNGSSVATSTTSERPLFLGTRGTDVQELQQFLKDKGFYTYPEITGYFGPVTTAALKAYQQANGLEPVGFVGPQTRAKLVEAAEVTPPVTTPSTPTPAAPRSNGESVENSSKPSNTTGSAISPVYSGSPTDTTGPIISSVYSGSPTDTTATITWTTNENADSQVEYGTTDSYGSTTALDTSMTTNHSVGLVGLTASTLYHYRVRSAEGSGNISYSSDATFTTDDPPQVALSVPSGFGWTPPFAITTNGSTYNTDFDIDAAKPAYTRTIYIGSGGSNLNDGLLHDNRVRSISAGITKANAYTGETVRLLIDPGEYLLSEVHDAYSDNWNGVTPTVNTVFEMNGAGRAISIHNQLPATVASTSDPNIYVVTFSTSVTRAAIDRTFTEDGQPQLLYTVFTVATSSNPVAELNAAWTTYGRGVIFKESATKAWVRLRDNRQPDGDVLYFKQGNNGAFSSALANLTLWMDGLTFWGAQTFVVTGGTGSNNPKLYAKDITYSFSQQGGTNGFSWATGEGESYHVNSRATFNVGDGFNYRGAVKALEVNTVGSWNGWVGSITGTNNGSTAHNDAKVIRLNAVYEHNENRNVHDIQNVKSWNLGVTATDSRTASGEAGANFVIGSAGVTTTTATMWLDGVTSSGSLYDLEAYDNTFMYVANTASSSFNNIVSGTPAGTITPYTP